MLKNKNDQGHGKTRACPGNTGHEGRNISWDICLFYLCLLWGGRKLKKHGGNQWGHGSTSNQGASSIIYKNEF